MYKSESAEASLRAVPTREPKNLPEKYTHAQKAHPPPPREVSHEALVLAEKGGRQSCPDKFKDAAIATRASLNNGT